jgi:hypothetical protein
MERNACLKPLQKTMNKAPDQDSPHPPDSDEPPLPPPRKLTPIEEMLDDMDRNVKEKHPIATFFRRSESHQNSTSPCERIDFSFLELLRRHRGWALGSTMTCSIIAGLLAAQLIFPMSEWFSKRDTRSPSRDSRLGQYSVLYGMTEDHVRQRLAESIESFHENSDFHRNRQSGAFAGQTSDNWYRIAYSPSNWSQPAFARDYFYTGAERFLPGQECVVVTYSYTHTNATYQGNKVEHPSESTTPKVSDVRYFSGHTTRWPQEQCTAFALGLVVSGLAYVGCNFLIARAKSSHSPLLKD